VILRAGFLRAPKFRVMSTLALAAAIASLLFATPSFATRVHRAPTSGHTKAKHHAVTPTKSHKLHGQQAMEPERVTAIQSALIKAHYLNGEPSAKWDNDTQAAMLKFQADQGWQTRITPDSRALIKLGLGPDHSDAINGGSGVNFNQLNTPINLPAIQAQGFIAGSGVSH
jgi:peptidoglycan hydrolase-like protein with peptidoglycan-binding domain